MIATNRLCLLQLVTLVTALLTVTSGCSVQEKSAELPNVILVMADDLGYGDLECYGNGTVRTPNLDAMAKNGMRFDRFYSAAPVCSPTRGSCLTGRHPYRYNMPWAGRYGMPEGEVTIGEAFKTKGYATGHFGKWHVGGLSTTVNQTEFPGGPSPFAPPWTNGFDECYSTESMMPTYNPYYHVGGAYGTPEYRFIQDLPVAEGQTEGGHRWKDFYWTQDGNNDTTELKGDDSKVIMDRALDFIERKANNKQPFLSLIWFHTPHTPVVAGQEWREKYPNESKAAQHWYGAISAMDAQVGALRAKLKELGISDNTIVWFCSDNGPSYIHNFNSSGGLRGKKAELYEGGVRVPSILEWPKQIDKESLSSLPVSTSDFYPTLLQLCEIEIENQPQLDGVSVCKKLIEGDNHRETPIMFQSPCPGRLRKDTTSEIEQYSVIDNEWKLISIDNGENFQLYNLHADPTETNNVSNENQKRVKEMHSKLEKWRNSCKQSAQGKDYK